MVAPFSIGLLLAAKNKIKNDLKKTLKQIMRRTRSLISLLCKDAAREDEARCHMLSSYKCSISICNRGSVPVHKTISALLIMHEIHIPDIPVICLGLHTMNTGRKEIPVSHKPSTFCLHHA